MYDVNPGEIDFGLSLSEGSSFQELTVLSLILSQVILIQDLI